MKVTEENLWEFRSCYFYKLTYNSKTGLISSIFVAFMYFCHYFSGSVTGDDVPILYATYKALIGSVVFQPEKTAGSERKTRPVWVTEQNSDVVWKQAI